MPTDLELAMISKQVYFKRGGFVHGWTCKEYYQDNTGLATGVYENNKNNETVIAFRGTDTGNVTNFLENLKTNIEIALGREPGTFKIANKFVNSRQQNRTLFERFINFIFYGSRNQLYLTGHSQGGMIAMLVGYLALTEGKKYRVLTFENPGIKHLIDAKDLLLYKDDFLKNFFTYVVDPNLINTLHPHIGCIRRIHLKSTESSFFARTSNFATNAVDCLTNDILRIMLLLLFLQIIIGLDMTASFRKMIPSYLKDQMSIPEDDESMDLLTFLLYNLLPFILTKNFTTSVVKIARQHPIDRIISQLTAGGGIPLKSSKIIDWPSRNQYAKFHLYPLRDWLNPLKSPSLLTLMRQEQIQEEKIREMEGYQEESIHKSAPPMK